MSKQIAVFGGGCFWCTETTFKQLKGVESVMPGYAGGDIPDPGYYQVASGKSGHAEVIQVEYDSEVISFDDLLGVFFTVHDPTTLNRQGADVGTQYRSIILYTTDEQKKQADDFIKKLEADKVFTDPIVTEIKQLDKFYLAEPEHIDYYNNNKNAPYCQLVINPKLKKLKLKHQRLLKE